MTASEHGVAVAEQTAASRRRGIAANILVSVAALMLLLLAAADAFLLVQFNLVTRLFMLLLLIFVGWIPLALVITAVALRPYRVTFIAMGVVGAAFVATFVIVWMAPDAPYPYPHISWPSRGW